MEASKSEKARLGAFVVGTLAMIAVVLFFIVGKKVFTRKTAYFTRLSESVSGLELGTPVKQNGVDVGNITAIGTDSGDVTRSIIQFEVARKTPMKTDMVATMGSYGITGLKYLEITGGSYSSPDIPEGGEVKSSMSLVGKLGMRADSIAHKFDLLLGNVIAITDVQNRQHIDNLIASSAALSRSLDSLVLDIGRVRPGRRMDAILGQMESVSRDLQSQVKKAEIDKTVQEYKKAAEGITQVSNRVDITVMRVQEDLAQTMNNLKETMKNMNTFSRQIKENPSILLRGESKQERQR